MSDTDNARRIERLHPELWDRLVPELRAIADHMEAKPVPSYWLTNHRATVREAADSIERLRAAVNAAPASPERPEPEPVAWEVECETCGARAVTMERWGTNPLWDYSDDACDSCDDTDATYRYRTLVYASPQGEPTTTEEDR